MCVQYVVLFFYPADWTFVCPTEIHAFSDRVQEFKDLDCQVIGVSVDTANSHLAWAQTPRNKGGLGGCTFPLLGDVHKATSNAYGVVNTEVNDDAGLTFRGLFIISDKGILRSLTINDFPVGRSVDEVLRLVKAFKFTDEHGEVCPANWKPGSKTMIANPDDSKAYFESL